MRVYFLSTQSCALKINGTFLGFTDGFERFVELSLKDSPFCELIPTDGRIAPLVFTLNENVTTHPPDGVSLYLLPDALAVYADKFIRFDPTLQLIERKDFPFCHVIVFSQGIPQALWERDGENKIILLDERFFSCTVHGFGDSVLLEGKNCLCALNGAGEAFFKGTVKNWSYDEERAELRLSTPLNDFCARTADCVWDCTGAIPVLKSCSLSPARELPPEFILCVFLQNLLFGADVRETLSDELYSALDDLKGFFGKYESVTPTPRYPLGAGTVCRKNEKVYEIKYYRAEVENGKIVNVMRER